MLAGYQTKGVKCMRSVSKIMCLSAVLGLIVMSSGCKSMKAIVPGEGLPLADIKTTATYDVIGPATGTASGQIILGFIALGVPNEAGAIATGTPAICLDPIKNAATYKAIESVVDADALVAPRWHIETTDNWIVYKKVTATVKGKAIRYNPSVK